MLVHGLCPTTESNWSRNEDEIVRDDDKINNTFSSS
jgi:hypothetical protein